MSRHRRAPDEESDRESVWAEFNQVVNMAPAELERWLQSEDSRNVGWVREGDAESVGHESGRRIVRIKRARKADLTDEDYRHMRKVVGYVHRHTAQGGPAEGTERSRWRYSLMNWGHDPLKH